LDVWEEQKEVAACMAQALPTWWEELSRLCPVTRRRRSWEDK